MYSCDIARAVSRAWTGSDEDFCFSRKAEVPRAVWSERAPHMSRTIPAKRRRGHSLGSEQVATTPIPPRELLRRIDNHHDDKSDEWWRRYFESSGQARRDAI